MPCWALFEQQEGQYRRTVLGTQPRLAIEAGCPLGWDRYIGEKGAFLGMHGFGASGPAKDVYSHFGITAEAAAEMAKELLT